jgi:DNA-binding NarL/FixJ family response regulator
MKVYEIHEKENGLDVLALHEKEKFDLIICDIVMPEKEGIETIKELKDRHPDVKIISMSGSDKISPENYLFMTKLLGVEIALAKPFRTEYLYKAVEMLIGH